MNTRAYLLCTAPRSGSTMLCGMLKATGVAGAPQSFFHRPSMADWARSVDLPETAPLADILTAIRGTATGGLFGVRLQQHSFAHLMGVLAPFGATDRARIEAALGPTTYLWLRREDRLAQAISYLRAQETGLWHRNADGTDLERLERGRVPGYDADAITAQIEAFAAADRAWSSWFADQALEPLTLTYETLSAAPHATLRTVLEHLGQDPARADPVAVPTRKLADATSDTWSARYRAEVLAKRRESP